MGKDLMVNVNDVIKAIDKHTFETDKGLCLDDDISCILENIPSVNFDDVIEQKEVTSKELYEQVALERDVATEQLRELGYNLGAKIITCKNCEHWGKKQGRWHCFEMYFDQDDPTFYCGYAKKEGRS